MKSKCARGANKAFATPWEVGFDLARPLLQVLGKLVLMTGAIIATTMVVVAVYAPIGFAQGMVGTIYLQFSLTMCIALCLSTVCALTLSCSLGARVLRKAPEAKGFFKTFNALFDRLRDGAAAICRGMINVWPITMLAFLAIAALAALSFVIGVLPLLFATGAGANSRHAVGVATFWGMLTATLVGMLFVPPLYVVFRRLAGRLSCRKE